MKFNFNKIQWNVILSSLDWMAKQLNYLSRIGFEDERGKAECRTCLFGYSGDSDDGHIVVGGDCREKPPVIIAGIVDGDITQDSAFPKVLADGWCGQYRRRSPQ